MSPTREPQMQPLHVTDSARKRLVRTIRVAFPHPRFPDGPYERSADKVIEAAKESTWLGMTLVRGLESLDAVSGGSFLDLDDADATRVLGHLQTTDFFGFVRRTAVVDLYDDPEVWEVLGYEGPSFDKGGYLTRGFDDLDWLPDPRVEEYQGAEKLVEVASQLPVTSAPATSQQQPEKSAAQASYPGVAPQQAEEAQ